MGCPLGMTHVRPDAHCFGFCTVPPQLSPSLEADETALPLPEDDGSLVLPLQPTRTTTPGTKNVQSDRTSMANSMF
jgi:hypothetical protein